MLSTCSPGSHAGYHCVWLMKPTCRLGLASGPACPGVGVDETVCCVIRCMQRCAERDLLLVKSFAGRADEQALLSYGESVLVEVGGR